MQPPCFDDISSTSHDAYISVLTEVVMDMGGVEVFCVAHGMSKSAMMLVLNKKRPLDFNFVERVSRATGLLPKIMGESKYEVVQQIIDAERRVQLLNIILFDLSAKEFSDRFCISHKMITDWTSRKLRLEFSDGLDIANTLDLPEFFFEVNEVGIFVKKTSMLEALKKYLGSSHFDLGASPTIDDFDEIELRHVPGDVNDYARMIANEVEVKAKSGHLSQSDLICIHGLCRKPL